MIDNWWVTDPAHADEPDAIDELKKFDSRFKCFATPELIVAWEWDGDGVLLVGELNAWWDVVRAAINTDCKKTYGWYWLSV